MKIDPQRLAQLEPLFTSALKAARIPGAALAVISGTETVYARGFGLRDLKRQLPVTASTFYPIASTTKAMNATLLAMLVEEGKLEWDAPVQRYLPHFQLHDAAISHRVTVRDLVSMRTGLPRHDWLWAANNRLTRPDLVKQLAHLKPAADFRQIFQYNNLTATVAGHIAEVITGESWETLVRDRLLRPLEMRRTLCADPSGNATRSYHENARRQLLLSERLPADVCAPSGGSIHSTVADMARWVAFNLNGGKLGPRRLLEAKTLEHLHTPQVIIGNRSLTGMPPDAAYALGWMTRHFQGHLCVTHGGYLHDVNSSVMFFPELRLGFVSFINFGCPGLADWINQRALETLLDLKPAQTLEQKLGLYEKRIADTHKKLAAAKHHPDTKPTLPLADHAGRYHHPGYGDLTIQVRGRHLVLHRHALHLPLKHWHFDTWVSEEPDFWAIHAPHPFDRIYPVQFTHKPDGTLAGLSVQLETEVAPIRFQKTSRA